MKQKALVILSGGQDSTTCVYWAIERFGKESVESLTFDYGQLHRHELQAASRVAAYAGIPNVVLPINTFEAIGGSALTDPSIEVPRTTETGSLPATFVPGRNLVFLTFAAAYAWRCDIQDLVIGVAQTDYSGYPDCRRETIDALEKTLALGLERRFTVHTPLMNLSKKETVLLAKELGAMDAMALTHTCYNGSVPPCGECAACLLRAKGFAEAGIPDPLIA
ncbi:MAG TPA: 7-cyano-7-deazaguanine synthase QueC [Woeseiaceae bacterium]|jgi:7-cyano-7-deazaguanine synthase|nr:7-cyano-7-deazaguanine synthase QueC [Woeseiaceae bacterium]